MIESKRKRLETKGWKIGSTGEFLDLNDQEETYVELRLKLTDALKHQRISRNLTQGDLAKAVSSSRSRVAKMEAGDAYVSLDILIQPFLVLGRPTAIWRKSLRAQCPVKTLLSDPASVQHSKLDPLVRPDGTL